VTVGIQLEKPKPEKQIQHALPVAALEKDKIETEKLNAFYGKNHAIKQLSIKIRD